MKEAIPRLFADITAKLEDMHSVAVEGQRCDNTPDMERVLACHLRMGIVALDGAVEDIKQRLGDDHD